MRVVGGWGLVERTKDLVDFVQRLLHVGLCWGQGLKCRYCLMLGLHPLCHCQGWSWVMEGAVRGKVCRCRRDPVQQELFPA